MSSIASLRMSEVYENKRKSNSFAVPFKLSLKRPRRERIVQSNCRISFVMTMFCLFSVRRGNAFVSPVSKGRFPFKKRIGSKSLSTLRALDSRELRFMGGYSTIGAFSATFDRICRQSSKTLTTSGTVVLGSFGDNNNMSPVEAEANQKLPLPPRQGYGSSIRLTPEEEELFALLREVRIENGLDTTLRVAGGWVRDKLLRTPEFRTYHKVWEVGNQRLFTSKFRQRATTTALGPSMGRQGTKVLVNDDEKVQPVDIDIALDDMLGREFADRLNQYLSAKGEEEISVGVVLKNPEKSKHLETATLKVGSFWIDLVNLRAEEYTQESRIPDLMRIGTASEDAFRRDLTINALFYNINSGQVEDWTGRGFDDLRKGIVATPLPPLTTLLDDPLRALRSVRFAARLRFSMADELVASAKAESVRNALAQKVSRERVGGELDLMLRSPDPVCAVRLLLNLQLIDTVFPIHKYLGTERSSPGSLFNKGLELLSTSHDHLADCRWSPPLWCKNKQASYGAVEQALIRDEESRRLLWYASFLMPLHREAAKVAAEKGSKRAGKKANRSVVSKLLVDDLKRPARDADAIERIIKASIDFTQLMDAGCDISATMVLLSDCRVKFTPSPADSSCGSITCSMNERIVDPAKEEDPVWEHAMEFRLLCAKVMQRIGPLWRAALFLSISEALNSIAGSDKYMIEGDVMDEVWEERRQGIIERYDAFATALQQIGLIGIWGEPPLLDGGEIKSKVLPLLPRGPVFRDVMDEQTSWMVSHPGAKKEDLVDYLRSVFPEYSAQSEP